MSYSATRDRSLRFSVNVTQPGQIIPPSESPTFWGILGFELTCLRLITQLGFGVQTDEVRDYPLCFSSIKENLLVDWQAWLFSSIQTRLQSSDVQQLYYYFQSKSRGWLQTRLLDVIRILSISYHFWERYSENLCINRFRKTGMFCDIAQWRSTYCSCKVMSLYHGLGTHNLILNDVNY